MFKLNSKKGFTLIELMIVVVIIGILAALAIPRYMQTANTSKQAEAKQILHQIFTLEQMYHKEFTTYWAGGPGTAAAPVRCTDLPGFADLPANRATARLGATPTVTVSAVSRRTSSLRARATASGPPWRRSVPARLR